jgi:hypothetical protein
MLTSIEISRIKKMKHDELLRNALSSDMGVLVEVSHRLHRATLWLNGMLVFLTLVLIGLTVELVRFHG